MNDVSKWILMSYFKISLIFNSEKLDICSFFLKKMTTPKNVSLYFIVLFCFIVQDRVSMCNTLADMEHPL